MPTLRRAGFTIPELLVALVAIAIVAGIAIPMHFARAEVTLENAGVLLARDLRAAQNGAAYHGRSLRVDFDDDGGGYRVLDPRGQVVEHPRTGEPFVRRYDRDRGFALESGRLVLVYGGDTRELLVERYTGEVILVGSTSGWVDDGY